MSAPRSSSPRPVPTARGTFLVVNRSRYRTDDLLDLLARIEATIPARFCRGGVPLASRLIDALGGESPVRIVFTAMRATGRPAGTDPRPPWIGRLAWHRPTHVRLAHPDDVWEGPMEQLAALVSPERRVPARCVRALVVRLASLYREAEAEGVPLHGAVLRMRSDR